MPIALSLSFGLLLAAALPLAGQCNRAPEQITLELADSGRQLHLCAGDTLRLRLQVQLGTGYVWKVRKSNSRLLSSLGEPEVESPGKTAPGGKEYLIFRFRAVRQGDTTLELVLARPWMHNEPPANVFTAIVAIESRKDP